MHRAVWVTLATTLACSAATTGSSQPAPERAATPTLSPPPGTYTSTQTVRIASATAGAAIHCTQDGSTPTAASPACPATITVSSTTTLQALTTAPGYLDSEVAGGTYAVQPDATPAATPTFAPPAGSYDSPQTVTISSATAGATIHCTRDGSAATAASPTCAAPLSISTTTTLRAVATAPGHTVSNEASATYTMTPVAATPTFAPPAGTYASTQVVTISSATAGATIHCTRDGTAAMATSPVCSDPISISTTTTLRAVATAPGHTVSNEASGTYTMGQAPSDFECARVLSTSRQLFGHQSVGNNILYGPGAGGGGGLDDILKANSGAGVSIVSNPASLSELPVGGWAEIEIGTNTNPASKIDAFDTLVRTRFQGQLDFAAFKFCFADIGESTDVASVWSHYQRVQDALERDFPGRIVHWTVPLLPDATDIPGNTVREQLSDLIRTRYGPTGRLFDLAALEAVDRRGDPVTLGGVPAMSTDWSANGRTDGHLNYEGAHRIALAYLHFMCGVKAAR